MKMHFINPPGEGQANDATAFAVLGVAALMMVGFAASAVLDLATGQDQFAATAVIRAPAVVQHESVTSEASAPFVDRSPAASDSATSAPRATGVRVPVSFTCPGTSSGAALVINF